MYKIEYLNHNWLSSLLHNRVFLKKLIYIKGRVVDLGCGTAPYKADVESVGASYIGVDWSNSVHNIQPDVVADLSKSFPFKDGYADTLLSFQVTGAPSHSPAFLK